MAALRQQLLRAVFRAGSAAQLLELGAARSAPAAWQACGSMQEAAGGLRGWAALASLAQLQRVSSWRGR